MYPAHSYQISDSRQIRLVIGGDTVLYRDTQGMILLLQLILLICFYFSVKTTIFVRLFDYRKVFALIDWWSDKRKLMVGQFRLHRLLYFTRGVGCPTPTKAIKSEWEK